MASHFWWLYRLQGPLLAIILLCTVRGAVCQSSSCLTAFKASVGDPSNALATWVDSEPVCDWSYVMCLHPRGNDVGELYLAGLGLQGELRLDLLKDCQSLGIIDLSPNNFSGTIPPQLSVYIPNLVSLNLSNNAIHGPIPATIGQVLYLNVLALQHNRLDGTIPPELGSLTRLKSLNLARNQLRGSIPPEIRGLHGLRALNLSHNKLSGSIPWSFGQLRVIERMDLSDNGLSGRIPPNLSRLTFMSSFDVSWNNLSGRVPTGGQFDSFDSLSYVPGNSGLCGTPLGPCSAAKQPGTGGNSPSSEEAVIPYRALAIGFILGFFAIMTFMFSTNKIRSFICLTGRYACEPEHYGVTYGLYKSPQ